ncbi:MAG: FAD-binding and (Fe-S)-binding domain-containing protein [Phycisphaerae bacterium]
MNESFRQGGNEAVHAASLARRLAETIAGEVRFDALSRTIYATDASLYEIIPLGVVLPKTVDDVIATVRECRAAGASIIPRGAGTGLTGGAVGPGVQIDLSRHLTGIGTLNLDQRTISVEPGVVLDELNAHLKQYDLQFAPDVATSSRATIGGMIANNSCGAHSVVYGRTVDHVTGLTVVLADGELVMFGEGALSGPESNRGGKERAASLNRELARIRDEFHAEIQRRFPKILRSNGGYGLDRLGPPGAPADAIKILCGSEGTLGIIVRATLKVVPTPKLMGLVLLHFDDVFTALGAVPPLLKHAPGAVELVDRMIIEGGRANSALSKRCDFLQGDPAAILIVELFDDEPGSLDSRLDAVASQAEAVGAYAAPKVLEKTRQADVWNLRKSGLGLLMSKPGDAQPIACVEDTAVAPEHLSVYIKRFTEILQSEGIEQAGYYAHASVGCIHMRPVLNLRATSDVERMRRIADAVSELAVEFGGTTTGEHGDGIIRSCWLEKMYGPRITAAFQRIKSLFDPKGMLNPHKIVDPWPMTEHLRYGGTYSPDRTKTHFDFSPHDGIAGLAQMCTGVGQCRQRFAGTMCPSYMATHDETHTTRARALALRAAVSNRGLLNGLDDESLDEVMDLCLSCKACKTECPTGVDMASLKAEHLARRHLTHGVDPLARVVADLPRLARRASLFPRISNLIARSMPVRAWVESRFGLDRRIPPPSFAAQTFRAWYRRHRTRHGGARGPVVYFVDCWTNYFVPQVGIGAVTLLERAGFDVKCPQMDCCGRPLISKGLLGEAKLLARLSVGKLARYAWEGLPIIGTEPSCILTFVDEYVRLVPGPAANVVAGRAMMIETFLRNLLAAEPEALSFAEPPGRLLYHAHCHQRALVGAEDAVALLQCAWGSSASQIDSGCCGMAGSFGYERRHYEVARAIGEERLFPAIRQHGDAAVAVSGFSCRHQIEQHTGVRPQHIVERLAEILAVA